jgi:peptidoglycan/xylan/chitin deacetylase (PgdA/CDA1 family)
MAAMNEAMPQITAAGRIPATPVRFAQAIGLKLGRRKRPSDGAAGTGRPWPLVRVDEFPHAGAFDSTGRFGTDAFKRFHAIFAEADVPYLLAVPPRVSHDYLDPADERWRPLEDAEIELLRRLPADGVSFGLHGLDHRTRHPSPRRHSELCGLDAEQAAARIDLARAGLAEIGIETAVFVPPFNRFDASQYDLLAERFDVVCGGPESIRLLGFQPTPIWLGEAVYLPSYAPLYGRAAAVLAEIERMIAAEEARWAPITLHWGWELEDDFADLRRLCARLAECTTGWGQFLGALGRSPATRPD